MSTEFWVGVFLSIPIGIATSLATPWLQRKLDERGKQRSLRESKNAQAEYEQMVFYKNHPEQFTQYLVSVAIKTTFIGAGLAIIAGFAFAGAQMLNFAARVSVRGDLELVRNALYIVGQFSSLIGSMMIVNICRPALSALTKLNNFPEYESGLKSRGLISES